MNFIWDIALRAQKDGLFLEDLFFKPSDAPSPCYEQSLRYINQSVVEEPDVEINPLMRFSEIFQYLLHPDVIDYLEKDNRQFILYAFDTIVHILTEVDLCHGMTRREFYVRRIRKEIREGVYGPELQDAYGAMTREEQLAVADEMLNITKMGSGIESFCRVVSQIFPGSYIYQVRKHPKTIYVYLDRAKTVLLEKKWNCVRDAFLPIDTDIRVFWDLHFGILGIDATMNSDAIAIF